MYDNGPYAPSGAKRKDDDDGDDDKEFEMKQITLERHIYDKMLVECKFYSR